MSNSNCRSDAAASAELSKPPEANLLEWLEDFAEKLKSRTNAVAEEVQQVLEGMDVVELNLQITFNNFRCLSSSQFVENHVYEEDETDFVATKISNKDAKIYSVPTENYEDEILPRYKDAVTLAWAAFRGERRQNDHGSLKPESRNRLRNTRQPGKIQILPHIIGSEEFTRDVHCGLADLGHWNRGPDADDYERQDKATLAGEPIDTGILSEGETTGTDSDGFDSQDGGEPAVSAALDFKAMLEAALRSPYDGGPSNDSFFGGLAENKFSLPNVSSEGIDNSPSRSISTMVDIIGRTMSTMDESKEELQDSTSQRSNANDDRTHLPRATESQEVLDNSITSSTLEEHLKKPWTSRTQATLNQEFQQYIDINNGNRQAGTGDLGHLPSLPGGFFNEEVRDTGLQRKEDATVSDSNTGPSIPAGLFQEELSSEPMGDSTAVSSRIESYPLPSLGEIAVRSSTRKLDIISINSHKSGSGKSQVGSSVVANQANLQSTNSSISVGSNMFIDSPQGGQLPSRGGLFDDDDDEDVGAGDLFGAPTSSVDNQGLWPWASQSSKGLFEDVARASDGTTSVSDEPGGSQEVQHNRDISSLMTSPYTSQSGRGVSDSLSRPVFSDSVETYSGSAHGDLARASDTRELTSNNEGDSNEVVQRPIHSTVAATVRSSSLKSDDGSWSGSESGAHDVIDGTIDIQEQIPQDAAMEVSENNESGTNPYQNRTTEGALGLMLERPLDSGDLIQSVSSDGKPWPIAMHEERNNVLLSSQPAREVLPSRFPPTSARTFPSTQTSSVEVSVKLAENPSMQSKSLELSDTEANESSGSPSHSGGLQVNMPGRSTRTFNPLFDEDEAEQDHSGSRFQQRQGALFPNTGQPGIAFPSDRTVLMALGQTRTEETEENFMTQNLDPQQSREPNPSSDVLSSSHSRIVQTRNVIQSAQSGAKLSSLLFGDDDDEDEDALFGPLGVQASMGLKSGIGGSTLK